jgi:hypothetical protein
LEARGDLLIDRGIFVQIYMLQRPLLLLLLTVCHYR